MLGHAPAHYHTRPIRSMATTGSRVSSSSTSGSATVSGCAQDSDCGDAGPYNTCRPGVQLCLAPLAPVASLKAAACQKLLAPCTPPAVATCGPLGTFALGSGPQRLAFDGTHMWVANNFDCTVTKL